MLQRLKPKSKLKPKLKPKSKPELTSGSGSCSSSGPGLKLSYSVREYWLLAQTWLLFIWVDLKIRFFPYRYWQSALKPVINQPPTDAAIKPGAAIKPTLSAARIIALSEKVARHHWCRINCLRRCLVQKQLLAQHGYNSQLAWGVKKQQAQLAAHCWLVNQQQLLNDSPANIQTYQELTANSQLNPALLR